mgnify:CR=1 FL=1
MYSFLLPLFYQRYLLKKLVKKAHEKLESGIDLPVSKDHLDRFKTLPEFDDVLTAPLYGFDNADPTQNTANGWETHFIIGQQF